MAANESYLSSERYGYDFVVSTTQASINAGLKEYLDKIDQPPLCYFFLYNDDKAYTLEQIQNMTADEGGVDPFDIPDGASDDDGRVAALKNIKFVGGFVVQIGLPPGVNISDLQQIVNLGTSADNVTFTFYASKFQAVMIDTYAFINKSQQPGEPWVFDTQVTLKQVDLDLDDNPYFAQFPEKKERLKEQLSNIGSTFSLQQLYFDLTSAKRTSTQPSFAGEVGQGVVSLLDQTFVPYYLGHVSENGEPILGVTAKVNQSDDSSLPLTYAERQVNEYQGQDGSDQEKEEAATLSYLCMTNNNSFPGTAAFQWDWVDLSEIANFHGVVAINRNTLADFYANILEPLVKPSCIQVDIELSAPCIFDYDLDSGQTPSKEITENGNEVLILSYQSSDQDTLSILGVEYLYADIRSSYTCKLSFSGNEIKIVQHLQIYSKIELFGVAGFDVKVLNNKITDTYQMYIDDSGKIRYTYSTKKDDDHNSLEEILEIIKPILKALSDTDSIIGFFSDILLLLANLVTIDVGIEAIEPLNFQSFVFPGANVFAYKDVKFSDYQDLTTAITYLSPETSRYLQ